MTRTRVAWLWAPVLVCMALIFYVSSLSDVSIPGDVSDTFAHSLVYTGLAVLLVRAIGGGLPAPVDIEIAVLVIGVTVAYGITDEIHQVFVPSRHGDVWDLVADARGAVIGVVACWAWGRIAGVSRISRRPTGGRS